MIYNTHGFEICKKCFEKSKIISEKINIAVQVNGKLRGSFIVSRSAEESLVVNTASELENVKKFLEEGQVVKTIYVPGKLVSFVVKT
jgi:leucyl-tRNA synthetase